MKLTTTLAVLLAAAFTIGCSDNAAQELYMTAQFEERQNNPQHAKDLYQEITIRYPTSSYAKEAQTRLTILNQVRPKQD
jgi:TolA-binding protein